MGALFSAQDVPTDPAAARDTVAEPAAPVSARPPPPPAQPTPSAALTPQQRLAQAMPLVTAATDADRAGNFSAAFQQYHAALETIVPILKDLPPAERAVAQAKVVEYMNRAETLKAVLTPPPKPSRARSDPGGFGLPIRPAPAAAARRPPVRAELPPSTFPLGAAAPTPESAALESEILSEIMDSSAGVSWDSIAGLDFAKEQLQEAVIRPTLRPDLYAGLRAPPKGVLLFGPPGTGKTLLARAVARESGATFFAMSASSLMSKWVGEGEKKVRALFAVAAARAPSVIFIDEVDSMLSKRSDGENDASRRLKTEFMVQLDGAASHMGGVFVLAATNRPWEIDDAVVRRLSKKIYIPLPDPVTRANLIQILLKGVASSLTSTQTKTVVRKTEGYSCSDLTEVCREAARLGVRRLNPSQLMTMAASEVDPISLKDFEAALSVIRPSVSPESLAQYETWNKGCGSS